MTVKIDTENFEFENGKKPRGVGAWGFAFGRSGAWTTEYAPVEMSFSAACQWARRFAKTLGASEVSLLP